MKKYKVEYWFKIEDLFDDLVSAKLKVDFLKRNKRYKELKIYELNQNELKAE